MGVKSIKRVGHIIAGFMAVMLIVFLASCDTADNRVVGTWYNCNLESGSEYWIQFDSDGTGRDSSSFNFTWRIADSNENTVIIENAMFAQNWTLRDEQLQDSYGNIYYKTEQEARAAYTKAQEEARAREEAEHTARIESTRAQANAAIESLREQLIGTWAYSYTYSTFGSYALDRLEESKVDLQETYTVVFNEDGTYVWNVSWYDSVTPDIFSDTTYELVSEERKGTWSIEYTGDEEQYWPSAVMLHYAYEGVSYSVSGGSVLQWEAGEDPEPDAQQSYVKNRGMVGFSAEYELHHPSIYIEPENDVPVINTEYTKQ